VVPEDPAAREPRAAEARAAASPARAEVAVPPARQGAVDPAQAVDLVQPADPAVQRVKAVPRAVAPAPLDAAERRAAVQVLVARQESTPAAGRAEAPRAPVAMTPVLMGVATRERGAEVSTPEVPTAGVSGARRERPRQAKRRR
jgi:hypothetical protein